MRALLSGPILALAIALSLSSPAVAQDATRTVVVEVGGLDSVLDDARWSVLNAELQRQGGVTTADVFPFSYRGFQVDTNGGLHAITYGELETCQTLELSEQRLAELLRTLQANGVDHVTVIGHSLGGVLALDMLADYPDLTADGAPFVRTVVTVDAPIGGLTPNRAMVALLNNWGACTAVDQFAARAVSPGWNATAAANAAAAQARGVAVRIVWNPNDVAVPAVLQQLDLGGPVNIQIAARDSGAHHSAVLNVPTAARILATYTLARSLIAAP